MNTAPRNAVLAITIAVIAVIAMVLYGHAQIQSIFLGPQLPKWPMFALFTIAVAASVSTKYYLETAKRQRD